MLPVQETTRALPHALGRDGKGSLTRAPLVDQDGAPVLMVGTDAAEVEGDLQAGRLRRPRCDGELRPWGWKPRRWLRHPGGQVAWRLRRGRCRECRRTHVRLPVVALGRRLDAVEVIGSALVAKVSGAGHRTIAARLGRPKETVRGWLRRAQRRAEAIRDHFTRLAHRWGCDLRLEPRGSPLGDALEIIGIAARAPAERWGTASVWHFVAGATNGALLSNTS